MIHYHEVTLACIDWRKVHESIDMALDVMQFRKKLGLALVSPIPSGETFSLEEYRKLRDTRN